MGLQPLGCGPVSPVSCQIRDDIRLEIKCMLNAMCLNYPEASHPSSWKNCLPWNSYLVPKRLGTTAIYHLIRIKEKNLMIISIYSEKAFEKIPNLWQKKSLNKLGTEGA